jgi:hypothetical protein
MGVLASSRFSHTATFCGCCVLPGRSSSTLRRAAYIDIAAMWRK